MESLKRTPLFEEHVKLGARIVPFAGWEMPVQYKGIREEHLCVREKVGLFDVSHMGEIWFEGPNALPTLQWLTPNDVSKLTAGKAQYSLLTRPSGGIVDDIIIYCVEPNAKYLVCVNAANIDKDFQWMTENNKGAVIRNESSEWGQIAVQGPRAVDLLCDLFGARYRETTSFSFIQAEFDSQNVIVARTGYTGEDGGEIFVPKNKTAALWRKLLEVGAQYGVQPIGLGARDTLRTEMKYSLYGHEITDETNPIEAGLGWVVKMDKGDFIGRSKIAEVKEKGPNRKLIGFQLIDKGIARDGYGLLSFDNKEIGKVTSGTHSPSLNVSIGIGYVPKELSKVGTEILVDIRGRGAKAVVVATPFVKGA